MKQRVTSLLMMAVVFMASMTAIPAAAQGFGTIQNAPLSGACIQPQLGNDLSSGGLYTCGPGGWLAAQRPLGVFQGTTATAITTTAFTTLTGPAIPIPKYGINTANRTIRIKGFGVYTTGAASLLGVRIVLCTVSGCATGTVVAPAGCSVVTTNQANVLANGQFAFECVVTTATTGSAGTLMAKAFAHVQLGAATTAALSTFADQATAVSAAVDLTVAEYVHPQFQFATSNAANTATIQQMTIEAIS